MYIKKIKSNEKALIKQIDDMYIEFLKTELKYDSNYNMLDKYGSFEKDIEKEDKFGFVCVEDKEILGYIYGYIEKNRLMKETVIHLTYLYVKKQMRKQGIASKLLKCVEEYAKEKSINIIELKCFNDNDNANKLYKKYNYIPLWSNYRKEI